MSGAGCSRGGDCDVVDLVVSFAFKPVGGHLEDMRL